MCGRFVTLQLFLVALFSRNTNPAWRTEAGVTLGRRDIHVTHTGSVWFSCQFCGRRFKSEPGRDCHEELHTGVGYTCRTCGMIFSVKANLQRHTEAVHEKRTYPCHICNKHFSQAASLVRHQKASCLRISGEQQQSKKSGI